MEATLTKQTDGIMGPREVFEGNKGFMDAIAGKSEIDWAAVLAAKPRRINRVQSREVVHHTGGDDMRMYTRGGDQGQTSIMGGIRRSKADIRVATYGSVDEAGAFLGLAAAYLDPQRDEDIISLLSGVQQRLWDVGADLAAVRDNRYTWRTRRMLQVSWSPPLISTS